MIKIQDLNYKLEMEKSGGSKSTKHSRLPRKPNPRGTTTRTIEDFLKADFTDYTQFLAEAATGGRRGFSSYGRDRIEATRVKELLEHQLAMLRLTRQMNKLLNDLSATESRNSKYFEKTVPSGKPKKSSKANEYVIFSGGIRGLEYSSLKKSRTGTFRMEIDVSDYEPEHVQIHTENNKTMHVKAYGDSGVRKTLKIVSPTGIDIDDVIIHYPHHGILLLEAP